MLKIAEHAARKAGKIVLNNFNKKLTITKKGENDLVSNADHLAEACILHILKKNFPEHHISSEESGELGKTSPYVWVVDPIDGTINYTRHIEPFSISIGLLKKQRTNHRSHLRSRPSGDVHRTKRQRCISQR